jgi:hypothetical protein
MRCRFTTSIVIAGRRCGVMRGSRSQLNRPQRAFPHDGPAVAREAFPMKHLSLLALSILTASACATEGEFIDRADEVEGIYQVTSHLLNDKSCSPGGTAFSDQHSFAFAKRNTIFGHEYLHIYSCASLQDCRQKAALPQFEGNISFSYTLSAVDGDVLTGFEVTTGFTSSIGVCTMPELSSVVLKIDGEQLSLEKSTKIGSDYPAQNGVCTTDKGREASEGASCSQMETLKATLVEAL